MQTTIPVRYTAPSDAPSGWKMTTIGESCEPPQYGFTESASKQPIGPKFVRITDIQESGVDWNNVPYCICSASDQRKYGLQAGDILIARIGATTGKSFIVGDCPTSVFASYLIRIRPLTGIDARFLFYALNTHDYWQQVNREKHDKLKGGVNAAVLKKLMHPVPPLNEQRAIAAVLSKLQAAIAAQQAIIDRTAELKAALMAKLFTEGTGGEAVLETDIGLLPRSWKVATVRDVADIFSGGTPSKGVSEYWKGGIPWVSPKDMKQLRLRNVTDHISEAALIDGSRLAPAKAIFVVIRGMILAKDVPICMAAVPMAFNQDMKAIVVQGSINPDYVLHALRAGKGRLATHITSAGHGTRRIDTESIAAMRLPIPSLEEQDFIADVFDSLESRSAAAERQKQIYQELFAAMLDELMTGRIRVDNLDLNEFDSRS